MERIRMYGDCLSHIERLEQLTRKNLAGNTLIQVRKLYRETPPLRGSIYSDLTWKFVLF